MFPPEVTVSRPGDAAQWKSAERGWRAMSAESPRKTGLPCYDPGLLVVLNVASGRLSDPAERNALRTLFNRHDLWPRIVETADAAALCTAVDQDRSDMVVAGGGDGTISAVARRLTGTGRTLGVI